MPLWSTIDSDIHNVGISYLLSILVWWYRWRDIYFMHNLMAYSRPYNIHTYIHMNMVPALTNVQIIFSYLWLLYGDVHMEAIHHWD